MLPNGRWNDKTRPSSLDVDQDAIRDQVVRLEKVKGTENEADLGTKDLDGPTHQRLLKKTAAQANPVQTASGLIATASSGNVAEARGAGDEGDIWTLSAQATIAMLLASLTCMLWGALRWAVRQHNAPGENR